MTWRAVYCFSGQEIRIAEDVAALGIETFCPYERFRRFREVRGVKTKHWKNIALFPGYFFAETDAYLDRESGRGIISTVKVGHRLLELPPRLVSSLKAVADPTGLIRSEDITRNSYHFRAAAGDQIKFKSHTPLGGLVGKIASLARLDETGEVLAWVNLLGRETEVRLHYTDVSEVLSSKSQAA